MVEFGEYWPCEQDEEGARLNDRRHHRRHPQPSAISQDLFFTAPQIRPDRAIVQEADRRTRLVGRPRRHEDVNATKNPLAVIDHAG
jgi:hypothetical protein